MVDERDDKYEGQEEGEYHFSDDHAAYEIDTETTKVADVAVAKSSPLGNITRYRRILIAGIVFIILMLVIYKMVTPSGLVPPNTDISQQAVPPSAVATAVKNATPKPVMAPTATPPSKAMPAVQQPVQTATAAPSALPPQQQPIASMQPAAPAATNSQVSPLLSPPVSLVAQPTPSSPPLPVQQQAPNMPPNGGTVNYAQSDAKELADRLAALEQQNAKLTNVMQIEYAQKIADYENQSAALQSKLRELGSRVANMEAALNQITQLLQGGNKQISMSPSTESSANSVGPKQNYTVQAIIPGRAWLKSDSGDTVTVAEGDVLRDYGRITKIDPYDGVVDIDTGNKVISLSYGAGGDS